LFRRILERLSEMVDDLVQTAIEVDEGLRPPQTTGELFASDQFAGVFEQREQQLDGLIAEGYSTPAVGQLARSRIKSKRLEVVSTRGRDGIPHGRCPAERASLPPGSNDPFTEK